MHEIVSLSEDGHEAICQDCIEKHKVSDAIKELVKTRTQALKNFVAVLAGKSIKAPHDSELAAALIKEMGGLQSFVRRWKNLIDRMEMSIEVPTKTLMDQYREIAKLIHYSTLTRETAPDLASISDDDLETMLGALAAQVLTNNPDIAKEVLARHSEQTIRPVEPAKISVGSD